MLTPLLKNRASDGRFTLPDDGWYQIAPLGRFPHPDSGLVQVVDQAAVDSIVNRFKTESSAQNFPGLLIDYEHFSYDDQKPSEAAGWITELQNRADGLYGQIRWTAQGETDVCTGRYRFLSPVWLANQVSKLADKLVRPLRLDSAGLTNMPNLRGIIPLSNRAGSGDPADKPTEQPTKGSMKNIATKLGLSAEASEDAILAEVVKLQNRATEAEQAKEPLKTENARLKSDNAALLAAQVESDLEAYKNRFKPELREKWKAALLANRAGAIELLESMPETGTAAAGQAVLTRAATKTPTGAASGADPQSNAKKAAELTEDYRLANRCSHEVAHNHIRRKHPELFGL